MLKLWNYAFIHKKSFHLHINRQTFDNNSFTYRRTHDYRSTSMACINVWRLVPLVMGHTLNHVYQDTLCNHWCSHLVHISSISLDNALLVFLACTAVHNCVSCTWFVKLLEISSCHVDKWSDFMKSVIIRCSSRGLRMVVIYMQILQQFSKSCSCYAFLEPFHYLWEWKQKILILRGIFLKFSLSVWQVVFWCFFVVFVVFVFLLFSI